MRTLSAHQTYQQTRILTASQKELIVMLYTGAINFLRQSRGALEEERIEDAHNALVRAKRIVAELLSSVNEDGGELALNLRALYAYLFNRLIDANLERSTDAIDDVIGILSTLKEGWEKAEPDAPLKESGEEPKGT